MAYTRHRCMCDLDVREFVLQSMGMEHIHMRAFKVQMGREIGMGPACARPDSSSFFLETQGVTAFLAV